MSRVEPPDRVWTSSDDDSLHVSTQAKCFPAQSGGDEKVLSTVMLANLGMPN